MSVQGFVSVLFSIGLESVLHIFKIIQIVLVSKNSRTTTSMKWDSRARMQNDETFRFNVLISELNTKIHSEGACL